VILATRRLAVATTSSTVKEKRARSSAAHLVNALELAVLVAPKTRARYSRAFLLRASLIVPTADE
jgi:hypothetical protein